MAKKHADATDFDHLVEDTHELNAGPAEFPDPEQAPNFEDESAEMA